MSSATVKVTAPGDFEIVMTREFHAPRRLVFEAWTKPEYVSRWLLGPPGWTMPVCEIDLRVGGAYKHVWRNGEGREFGSGGVYREIAAPERTVATERMDGHPGEAVVTNVFTEHGGKTVSTMTMRFDTKEARDGALKSGMEKGMEPSYARLDEILAEME